MYMYHELIISWLQQNKAQPSHVHISWDIVFVAPAQTKWPIFCRQHIQAHFLFENCFILAECLFANNWGPSLGEGKEDSWGKRNQGESLKKVARKSRLIQCMELEDQPVSLRQHCCTCGNPSERTVMPRYFFFIYFLMTLRVFLNQD